MRKREEIADPNSCLNRAADDEIIFVLLARDLASPAAILEWALERCRQGKNRVIDGQIAEALQCALDMGRQYVEKQNHTGDGCTCWICLRLAAADLKDNDRCAICGWTISPSAGSGCIRGNCSLRPFPPVEKFYDRNRAADEYCKPEWRDPAQAPGRSPDAVKSGIGPGRS